MKSTGPLWSEKTHSCLSLSCAVTARLHKPRPPQVLSPCTFSLGSPPFLTASLNHSSAWNLPQRWQIMDYLTSLGKCCKNNQKKKKISRVWWVVFPMYCLSSCLVMLSPYNRSFALLCPIPSCCHLDGAQPHRLGGWEPRPGQRFFFCNNQEAATLINAMCSVSCPQDWNSACAVFPAPKGICEETPYYVSSWETQKGGEHRQ